MSRCCSAKTKKRDFRDPEPAGVYFVVKEEPLGLAHGPNAVHWSNLSLLGLL